MSAWPRRPTPGSPERSSHSDGAADGIVAPSARDPATHGDVEPLDPIAVPGVESVERQGAPPRVGTGTGLPAVGAPRRARRAPRPCSPGAGPAGPSRCTSPKADSYSLRLVAGRRLYDAGSSVPGRPSLTPLVPTLVRCGPTPTTSTASGAVTGDRVQVRSARGELVLAAEADAARAPRASSPSTSTSPVARARRATPPPTLIDSRQPVTDVRLESV